MVVWHTVGVARERMRRLTELRVLVDGYDTRRANMLVSTALTAVLSNHLAWVHTVMPEAPDAEERRRGGGTEPLDIHRGTLDSAQLQARYPYSPLWTQLSDLYGAVGVPAVMARTVVHGRDEAFVHRLLFVLTYFIRCVRRKGRGARDAGGGMLTRAREVLVPARWRRQVQRGVRECGPQDGRAPGEARARGRRPGGRASRRARGGGARNRRAAGRRGAGRRCAPLARVDAEQPRKRPRHPSGPAGLE